MGWLTVVAVTAGAVVLFWAVLVVAARRLPPGPTRELVAFLPGCVTLVRNLRHDPAVPRSAKVALGVAALWVLSPIDLIPEFLPVVGPLDDVVVVAIALRFAARRVPVHVLVAAWPGDDPSLLLKVVGRSATPGGSPDEPGAGYRALGEGE